MAWVFPSPKTPSTSSSAPRSPLNSYAPTSDILFVATGNLFSMLGGPFFLVFLGYRNGRTYSPLSYLSTSPPIPCPSPKSPNSSPTQPHCGRICHPQWGPHCWIMCQLQTLLLLPSMGSLSLLPWSATFPKLTPPLKLVISIFVFF